MPDKFFLSASGSAADDPQERVLWSGRCAVAEYAFEKPASLPRWTLPEETEVVVTEDRVIYQDPATLGTGELRWTWPQHLRVQPGNRDTGRSATVTQIQLVCAGPAGTYPALVFAGGDLATVGDADRLANTLRQAIARYRVEHAGELGLTPPQERLLSRLVIGPEFANYQGGEGQTVSLMGASAVARPEAPASAYGRMDHMADQAGDPYAQARADTGVPYPNAAWAGADEPYADAAQTGADAPYADAAWSGADAPYADAAHAGAGAAYADAARAGAGTSAAYPDAPREGTDAPFVDGSHASYANAVRADAARAGADVAQAVAGAGAARADAGTQTSYSESYAAMSVEPFSPQVESYTAPRPESYAATREPYPAPQPEPYAAAQPEAYAAPPSEHHAAAQPEAYATAPSEHHDTAQFGPYAGATPEPYKVAPPIEPYTAPYPDAPASAVTGLTRFGSETGPQVDDPSRSWESTQRVILPRRLQPDPEVAASDSESTRVLGNGTEQVWPMAGPAAPGDLDSRAADLAARVAELVSGETAPEQSRTDDGTPITNLSSILIDEGPTDEFARRADWRDQGRGSHLDQTRGLDAWGNRPPDGGWNGRAGHGADEHPTGSSRAEQVRRTAARLAGNSARVRSRGAPPPQRRADDEAGLPQRGSYRS